VRKSIRREKEVRNRVDLRYCLFLKKKKRNRRERSVTDLLKDKNILVLKCNLDINH